MRNREAYKIEFVSGPESVERISGLFKKNGELKSLRHLKWQYLENPGGGAYTAIAVSAIGEDAAVYNAIKTKGQLDGDSIAMVQGVDLLTDSQHRGRGLFKLLYSAVFEQCRSDKMFWIWGFPNANAAPGYFGKLGWRSFGFPPFQFHLCNLMFPLGYISKRNVFRVRNVIAQKYFRSQLDKMSRKRQAVLENDAKFLSSDYALLWDRFSKLNGLKVCRDGAYMSWRYKKKPGDLYQYVSIFGTDNSLQGIAVFRIANKHGGRVGYLMDVIVDPDDEDAARMLVMASLLKCYEQAADVVLAWSPSFSTLNAAYRKGFFLPMPRALQPIKLYFGAHCIAEEAQAINSDNFFLSYADSDTV